jgi:fatty acid desaturase
MTTEEQARTEQPRSTRGPTDAAGPLVLIILAILCGAGALVLVVFGVWPAVILMLAAGLFAVMGKRRLRKIDQT